MTARGRRLLLAAFLVAVAVAAHLLIGAKPMLAGSLRVYVGQSL